MNKGDWIPADKDAILNLQMKAERLSRIESGNYMLLGETIRILSNFPQDCEVVIVSKVEIPITYYKDAVTEEEYSQELFIGNCIHSKSKTVCDLLTQLVYLSTILKKSAPISLVTPEIESLQEIKLLGNRAYLIGGEAIH